MIINEVTEGKKIPYVLMGNMIFFNNEMLFNLEKYERDYEISIDVCEDENFMLVNGLGRRYVAQVQIPAREYTEKIEDEENTEDEQENPELVPVPFDMDKVTLNLWGLD